MTMHYITGGTMPAQEVSYVVRDADHLLREKLLKGEFCYVLTPRQMGKSSLMIQTAAALRKEGVASASIDLSRQGYTLNRTQWYNGLLERLAECLDLEDEIEAFCRAHANHSPLQRWHNALRKVILDQIPGPVVLFLDEIDVTRRLSFDTDEFFAAIRAGHNERAQDAAYCRLTFCLLGVATPSDLIQDPLLTPFNVGSRIDLNDFTYEEASILRFGLGHDAFTNELLMQRIYYWTRGHPYLTQRLCKAVAENNAILTPDGVDRCCRALFLDPVSGYGEDNLAYVRKRLVADKEELTTEQNEERCAATLTLYQQMLSGKHVSDNEADAYVPELKLSGVVCAENGCLVVRNRIYGQVFDKNWVQDHMPGAELRRQRAAYLVGLLRAVAVSVVLLMGIGNLTLHFFHQASFAKKVALFEQKETVHANQARRQAEDLLYVADMNLVQQAYDKGEYGVLEKLLSSHIPEPGEEDLRGFEWRYFWRLMAQYKDTVYPEGKGIVSSGTFPPNVKWLAIGKQEGEAGVRNIASGQQTKPIPGDMPPPGSPIPQPGGPISVLAFSHDSELLAVARNDPDDITIWNISSGRSIAHLEHSNGTGDIAFSPDGKTLIAASWQGRIYVWDLLTKKRIAEAMPGQAAEVHRLWAHARQLMGHAFSPAGKTLRAMRRIRAPRRIQAFSPDGKTLAVASADSTVKLWNVATKREMVTLTGPKGPISSVAFSPDGNRLAALSEMDNKVWIWEAASQADADPAP